jgi:hypothetical protein
MLQPTVSRSVYLGAKHPSGVENQNFITLRQLRIWWCGAPSLTRGRVCRSKLLWVLACVVSQDSWSYFPPSDSRLPQPGAPGPRIYIPQEQGGPVIPPGTGFPFRRLLRLAGIRWRYSYPRPRWGRTNCLFSCQYNLRVGLGTDRMVNTMSNSYSTVQCVFVTMETCLPSFR